jgi:hypothetical protein
VVGPEGWVPPDRFQRALGLGRQATQELERRTAQHEAASRQWQEQQRMMQQQLVATQQEIAAMRLQQAQMQTRTQQQMQQGPPASPYQRPSSGDDWVDREMEALGFNTRAPQAPQQAPPQMHQPQGPPQWAQPVQQLQAEVNRLREREIRAELETAVGRAMATYPHVHEPRRLRMAVLDAAIKHGNNPQAMSDAARNYALEEQALGSRFIAEYTRQLQQAGRGSEAEQIAQAVQTQTMAAPGTQAPAMRVAPQQVVQQAPPPAPPRGRDSASMIAPPVEGLAVDGFAPPQDFKEGADRAVEWFLAQGYR